MVAGSSAPALETARSGVTSATIAMNHGRRARLAYREAVIATPFDLNLIIAVLVAPRRASSSIHCLYELPTEGNSVAKIAGSAPLFPTLDTQHQATSMPVGTFSLITEEAS